MYTGKVCVADAGGLVNRIARQIPFRIQGLTIKTFI